MKPRVKMVAETLLPTSYANFRFRIFEDEQGKEHVVLSPPNRKSPLLLRIHSSCLTSEVFHSQKCDCREQLQLAMTRVAKEGGMIIYQKEEGRGIGLTNKIRAYQLQEQGLDTVEANEALGLSVDYRDYRVAVAILASLKISEVRLLTNNPRKVEALETNGITVLEQLPLEVEPNLISRQYLEIKKKKLGHLINLL